MNEVSANPPLDYAPRPPWRKRKAARRLLALAVLLAVLVAAWQLLLPIAARWNLLALQRSCLQFSRDGRRPVFTQAATTDQRKAINAYLSNVPPGIVVAEWEQFVQAMETVGLLSNGTLFLHERATPSGQRRLVGVDLRLTWTPQYTIVAADLRLYAPGGILHSPRKISIANSFFISRSWGGEPIDLLRPDYGREISVYPGQPDANDPSRFTIPYEIDDRRGTIVGRLLDDDRVDLTVYPADDQPTTRSESP